MKHIKNKKALLFGGILCLAAAVIGISVAYNHDSSTIPNEFGVGQYRTIFTEQFTSPDNWKPCDETTKTFTVKNETDANIKVRIKYDEVWRNAGDTRNLPLVKDNVTLANVVLQNTNDWELKADGYYYYKNALAPNAITSSLFQKVILDCNANFGANNVCTETATGTVCTKPNDDYEGSTYHLKITAETIEADGADDEWAFALLDTGQNVNQALKRLAGDSSATHSSKDYAIKSITIVDELPNTIDPTTAAKTDLALANTDPIYAYDDGNHNIYIHADGRTIYANESCEDMFYNMRSLTSLTLSENFNTSNVTDMNGMFSNMQALTSLTLSESFDTSNVTNMRYLFSNMQALTSLTLSENFNTSNVTDMYGMFSNMKALTSLTLSENFNTSSVTDMSWMFHGMEALTSLSFPSSFDTSNVANMESMFFGASSLTSLSFPSSFNTSKVTKMNNMFCTMNALATLDLSSFNTSNVTDMSGMFSNMKALTSLTLSENFNTSNVTDMNGMFNSVESLTSLTLPSSFDTSNVTDMSFMLSDMQALTSLTLPNSFNTSSVTDMGGMFQNMTSLTSLTLPTLFKINSGTATSYIFTNIPYTATLNSTADQSVKTLWSPRPFRNE